MAQTLISITIFTYLAAMLFVGFLCSKKSKSADDFYLGGRSLGPFVTAMSAEASDMSSWLLMGLPSVAYLTGLADAGWTAIGLAVGTYLNWKIVAVRLRRFSHTLDAITIPSFFSQRYADHKHKISALSACIIILFFIPYTASAFAACGKLFSSIFDVDYHSAMILSAIIILVYTVWGGFLAVSFTDLLQSIVMSVALIFVLQYTVNSAGGFSAIMENSESIEGYFSLFHSHVPAETMTYGEMLDEAGMLIPEGADNLLEQEYLTISPATAKPYPLINIISTFAWGLGYFGMPHILLRFMAIRDEKKLPIARRVATVWVVISMLVALLIGIAGNALTATGKFPQLADAETIIINLANLLAQEHAAMAVIGGLILAGILAATMSTADSQLLVASSSVSQNLISEYWKKDLSPEKSLLVARLSIVVISIIAMFLASDPNSSVFGIVSFAWAGFGASFGPVMLLSLFWRRANLEGAMAGMISGGLMVFFWKYALSPLGGIFAIYELLPAFLTGLGVMIAVSLSTPAPNHEVELIFDASMMPVPPSGKYPSKNKVPTKQAIHTPIKLTKPVKYKGDLGPTFSKNKKLLPPIQKEEEEDVTNEAPDETTQSRKEPSRLARELMAESPSGKKELEEVETPDKAPEEETPKPKRKRSRPARPSEDSPTNAEPSSELDTLLQNAQDEPPETPRSKRRPKAPEEVSEATKETSTELPPHRRRRPKSPATETSETSSELDALLQSTQEEPPETPRSKRRPKTPDVVAEPVKEESTELPPHRRRRPKPPTTETEASEPTAEPTPQRRRRPKAPTQEPTSEENVSSTDSEASTPPKRRRRPTPPPDSSSED